MRTLMTPVLGIVGIVILLGIAVAWRVSTQRADQALAEYFDAFQVDGPHDGEDNQ